MERLYNSWDRNADGELSFNEFVTMCKADEKVRNLLVGGMMMDEEDTLDPRPTWQTRFQISLTHSNPGLIDILS